jgi:gas vesicle protein
MNKKITSGLIIGGLVGASVAMMAGKGRAKPRKMLMKRGRSLLRKSGDIINDVSDLFK